MEGTINELESEIITITTPDGRELSFYKLLSFDTDKGTSYIAYTDGTKDEEGRVRVFTNIYDPTGSDLNLYPIKTDEEWKMISQIMDNVEKDIANARENSIGELINEEK